MGWVKDTKANQLTTEAQKAHANGDWFFTPRLNYPATHHGLSGNIGDWSQMIQGIVSAGWDLQQWAVGQDSKGRPEAYPVFMRRS